ncbi:MAG: response regulator [Treponema sp.]|nr:response regulator [Treponema sp.]MCR5621964.1 response regulator [Treponema sp.]
MDRDSKIEKPLVFSAMEAAKICGVVNQTAINWIRKGSLKASTTPGGQYRVYPEDLVDFMRRNKMNVPQGLLEKVKNRVKKSDKTVLVVDDDKTLNSIMCSYLKSKDEEFDLYPAYDGFEAGSKMASIKPKAVVLDLDLPGVDGVKIIKNINESPDSFGRPAVLVVTALEDVLVEHSCKALGVASYFHKPVILSELYQSLKSLFQNSGSENAF